MSLLYMKYTYTTTTNKNSGSSSLRPNGGNIHPQKRFFSTNFFNFYYRWHLNYLARLNKLNQQQQQSSNTSTTTVPGTVNTVKTYQCLNNPGKKAALVMGLNYENDEGLRLRGCINDTETIISLLTGKFGYTSNDITLLTDNTVVKPTRKNIEGSLDALVNKVIKENIKEVFISYSGHGTYQRDYNGDETDGQDEALVPLDTRTSGIILDDQLHAKYLKRLPEGVVVFALMDCCHSGTILDLEYKYKHSGGKFNNGKWKVDQQKKLRSKIVKISGCRDNQYSWDAFIDGKWCGAMTSSFEHTIDDVKDCRELVLKMREYLKKNNYDQEPMLTCSYKCRNNDKMLI